MQECPCASPHGPLLPIVPWSNPPSVQRWVEKLQHLKSASAFCHPATVILSAAKEPKPYFGSMSAFRPLRSAQGDRPELSLGSCRGISPTSPAAVPSSTVRPPAAARPRFQHGCRTAAPQEPRARDIPEA